MHTARRPLCALFTAAVHPRSGFKRRSKSAPSRHTAILLALLAAACRPAPAASEPPPVQRHSYTPAAPERLLRFPLDHGPHRETAIEWWYFTGHVLQGRAAGQDAPAPAPPTELAGFEVTVFRVSPPAGPLPVAKAAGRPEAASLLSLHVAVTDLAGRSFRHATVGLRERDGVAAVAASSAQPLAIKLPGAEVTLGADGRFRLDAEVFDAQGAPLQVHAVLSSDKPVTLHGTGGYSRKGDCPSCASHYASFPRLRGSATVRSSGGERSGQAVAWFDHEFGSNVLSGGLTGWDWLALQLDDGWELMAAQTHDPAGRPAHRAGTLVAPDGKVTPLGADDLTLTASGTWRSPHSDAVYPARWRVQVRSPAHPLDAELVPKLADQEISGSDSALATYWEGTCEVRINQKPAGTSYLEMTGYDPHHLPHL